MIIIMLTTILLLLISGMIYQYKKLNDIEQLIDHEKSMDHIIQVLIDHEEINK